MSRPRELKVSGDEGAGGRVSCRRRPSRPTDANTVGHHRPARNRCGRLRRRPESGCGGIGGGSRRGDDGHGPVDLGDDDAGSGLQAGRPLDGGGQAGAPLLTAQADPAAAVVHCGDGGGRPADEGVDIGLHLRCGGRQAPLGPGAYGEEQQGGDTGEDHHLRPQGPAEEGRQSASQRASGDHEEGEIGRHRLDDDEEQGPSDPEQPFHENLLMNAVGEYVVRSWAGTV